MLFLWFAVRPDSDVIPVRGDASVPGTARRTISVPVHIYLALSFLSSPKIEIGLTGRIHRTDLNHMPNPNFESPDPDAMRRAWCGSLDLVPANAWEEHESYILFS
jgi:hypothetical protein